MGWGSFLKVAGAIGAGLLAVPTAGMSLAALPAVAGAAVGGAGTVGALENMAGGGQTPGAVPTSYSPNPQAGASGIPDVNNIGGSASLSDLLKLGGNAAPSGLSTSDLTSLLTKLGSSTSSPTKAPSGMSMKQMLALMGLSGGLDLAGNMLNPQNLSAFTGSVSPQAGMEQLRGNANSLYSDLLKRQQTPVQLKTRAVAPHLASGYASESPLMSDFPTSPAPPTGGTGANGDMSGKAMDGLTLEDLLGSANGTMTSRRKQIGVQ